MKKIIVIALLLFVSEITFSQQTNPSIPVTKADYLQKSKHQNTDAWILIGGGSVLVGIGFVIILNEAATVISNVFDPAPQKTSNTGEILFYTGIVAMAGSIPLFIASHRNKKKTMSLSFKNETAPQIQGSGFVYKSLPSLTLRISL